MASVQLVRRRNAQTHTTTKIDQAQSLELAQTMLHGALSTLTYLRNLFPSKAFEERRYEMRDTIVPYAEYAAARMPSVNDDADIPHTNLPILVRDRSKRADVFLDWLEKGAFPELGSGDLRAVQILIHPDKRRRNEVLESYTFIVRYVVGQDGRRTPSAVVTETFEDQVATTSSAHAALQELLRNVDRLCDDLPQLPSGRFLSMALVYDQKDYIAEPKHKRVEGFSSCKGDTFSLGEARGWQAYTRSLNFDSGYHDTLLKITALQSDGSSQTRGTLDIPKNLNFSNTVSRYNDILLMPPPAVPLSQRSLEHAVGFLDHRVSGSGIQRCPSTQGTDLMKRTTPKSNNAETQSSMVNSMSRDLHGMMHPEKITQGDTQAWGTFPQAAYEDSPTVTPTTLHASTRKTERFSTIKDTFPLRPETKQDISARKPYLEKAAKALAEKAGGSNDTGQLVLCQCGFGKDEGDMVQCVSCSTWQHLHCHGYTCSDDPRLPEEHVCYWCLLGDTDTDNYAALQEIAVQRRAMYHVSKSGMRTRTDLANLLGVEQKQASSMHAKIKKSVFVTQAAKSHKPGYRATGKALFVPCHDSAALRQLLETYFDPMAHISHHYGPPPAAEVMEEHMQTNQRLLIDLANDIPSPATPHGQKSMAASDYGRSESAECTPVRSRPDVPAAVVPTSKKLCATPSVNLRPQTRAKKRGLCIEEVEQSTAKRAATFLRTQLHFTSLRTLKVIDADGKSSPAM